MNIVSINYKDILSLEKNFVSLDISVRSTGWVRSKNGVIEQGTYSIKSEDELDRRVEFRNFLQDLLCDYYYDVVFVEDVIGGNNFNTTKGLIQLNTIVDDMKVFDLVKIGKIVREGNKKWKKYLKAASNYESLIKNENDKKMIVNALNLIGYSVEKTPDIHDIQDVYDAMGIAVSLIFREKVLGEKREKNIALKNDLKKNYAILQYNTQEDLNKALEKESKKRQRAIDNIDWSEEARDILYLFKQKVKKDKDDSRVYGVKVKSMKLGVLALTKKLNTTNDITYLLITKRK